MKTASSLELLEPRIAPASLTFTDVDGDIVKITTSGSGALTLGVNVIVTAGSLIATLLLVWLLIVSVLVPAHATNKLSTTGSLADGRQSHTATLLHSGKVLV